MKEHAEQLFEGTGVTISTSGERHMGAVIGSQKFKEEYITGKVKKWVEDVIEISKIAKDEPQAAYSCYINAISRRWSYFQRTIPEISKYFQPLEEEIRHTLIPALVGRKVSDDEREILALPVRYGGMGISNPAETADEEFKASAFITEGLTKIIKDQDMDFSNYNNEDASNRIKIAKSTKEQNIKTKCNNLMNRVCEKTKRMVELAQQKGSGAWLTALPMKKFG